MNANFEINELVIETERLILRPFRQSDLYDFNKYASVPGVGEMAGWEHHKTIEKTQESWICLSWKEKPLPLFSKKIIK